MKSYITMYENEQRAVELTIRDQDDLSWTPDAAYFKVIDSENTTVVAEAPSMVTGNRIYALITAAVTAYYGEYDLIWRITKVNGDDTYTFYHKTRIVVEEL